MDSRAILYIYREYTMARPRVCIQDPCPVDWPEIWKHVLSIPCARARVDHGSLKNPSTRDDQIPWEPRQESDQLAPMSDAPRDPSPHHTTQHLQDRLDDASFPAHLARNSGPQATDGTTSTLIGLKARLWRMIGRLRSEPLRTGFARSHE